MNDDVKHTPGEWLRYSEVAQGDGARFEVIAVSGFRSVHVCAIGPSPQAGPVTSVPDEERLGNARLIAAAPDLLAVVETMLAMAKRYMPVELIDAAQAAVAKAKRSAA